MRYALILTFLLLILTACGDVAGNPSTTVEQYLQAKVAGDREALGRLLCSEMEADLDREAASFASVEAELQGVSCSANGDIVSCEGTIVATYGREDREIPLSSYRVVQEDGEWRWCGEAE